MPHAGMIYHQGVMARWVQFALASLVVLSVVVVFVLPACDLMPSAMRAWQAAQLLALALAAASMVFVGIQPDTSGFPLSQLSSEILMCTVVLHTACSRLC